MRKIDFKKEVLPHIVAILVFLIVTLFFFSPVFFEKKMISQYDIEQGGGLAKDLVDYREATGEEGLWAPSAFSGMPAYLITVKWSNHAVLFLEGIYTLYLPHPVNKIFAAFLSFYCLLLAFRVRPWLAIAGALAFGLSSYMIIGLSVGHNARIDAISFVPLMVAGIHLVFNGKKLFGFAVTAMAFAFHLRANHLQITYYLMLIVAGYGIMQLVIAIREKKLVPFATSVAILIPAVLIGLGTFFGQFWAVSEYTEYSMRGTNELQAPVNGKQSAGLTRDYAFQWNYGLWEPVTLLIPKFYGGASGINENGEAYKALVQAAQSGDEKTAQSLQRYASTYWGPQASGTAGPYYAGAIVVFLFVIGIFFAEKKYVAWLVPLCVLSWMLSVGDSLPTFNYWMFDHFPGYNKFRSFSFALVIILFSMPLLGFIGLENLLTAGITKETKRKLFIAFSIVGGFCLLLVLVAGFGSYLSPTEQKFPAWFTTALESERSGMLRGDAFRSFIFISLVFGALYFDLQKRVPAVAFFGFFIVLTLIDLSSVDRRYFTKNSYKRRTVETFQPSAADLEVSKDKSNYRVLDLTGNPVADARPSYFHHSLGGYHGAKIRRYQDLYDSAIMPDILRLDGELRARRFDPSGLHILNMLNTKYIILSTEAQSAIPNPSAYGNAWFVKDVLPANSPAEELNKLKAFNPKYTAVIDASKFKLSSPAYDSAATVTLTESRPPYLKYESNSSANGLVIFSEIYYAKGWIATIDGKESPILRADYVLRALEVPSGKHVIEFTFKPKPYFIGNKVTMASSWLVLLVVLGSIGWTLKKSSN